MTEDPRIPSAPAAALLPVAEDSNGYLFFCTVPPAPAASLLPVAEVFNGYVCEDDMIFVIDVM